MVRKARGLIVLGALLALAGAQAHAAIYELADDGAVILGTNETIEAVYEDTLSDLARRFGLGFEEIVRVFVPRYCS